MSRPRRVNVTLRMSPEGRDRLDRIAERSENTDRSDLIREAVGTWLGQRDRDCTRGHKGPIVDSACGHCGREVA